MTLSKDDYERRARAYVVAFKRVADNLGKDHTMTKLMGGLAWGRYDAEGGPESETLRGAAVRYGFLWACERMLVSWCNEVGDTKARRTLLDTIQRCKREANA